MTKSAVEATGTSTGFDVTEFKTNAALYLLHKRLVDAVAVSKYDSIDDAIACLRDVWAKIERMAEDGSGYTPDREQGFQGDSADQVGLSILGRRSSVTETRKAFAKLGK